MSVHLSELIVSLPSKVRLLTDNTKKTSHDDDTLTRYRQEESQGCEGSDIKRQQKERTTWEIPQTMPQSRSLPLRYPLTTHSSRLIILDVCLYIPSNSVVCSDSVTRREERKRRPLFPIDRRGKEETHKWLFPFDWYPLGHWTILNLRKEERTHSFLLLCVERKRLFSFSILSQEKSVHKGGHNTTIVCDNSSDRKETISRER